MAELTVLIAGSAAGVFAAFGAALLPGIHIYNIMGLLVWIIWGMGASSGEWPGMLICSMVAAFSITSTVPVVYAAVADEGLYFSVSPAQEYVRSGRARDAVKLLCCGALSALFLITVAAPLWLVFFTRVIAVIRPHQEWIVWSIIIYLLLSEWPREQPARGWPQRLLRAAVAPGMGLLTFALSGLLGIIVMHTPLLSGARLPSQALMPACVGLFSLPWLIMNLFQRDLSCSEKSAKVVTANSGEETIDQKGGTSFFSGISAGFCGGLLAAFLPGVTAGVGGFLSGQAASTVRRDAFLISQGASRATYFAGCLLLTMLPGGIPRGGAGGLLHAWVPSLSLAHYYRGVGAIAFGALGAAFLLGWLCRWHEAVRKFSIRRLVTLTALVFLCSNILWATGYWGLGVMVVGGVIGCLPPLFGARRMNTLGVILLPVALSLSGWSL